MCVCVCVLSSSDVADGGLESRTPFGARLCSPQPAARKACGRLLLPTVEWFFHLQYSPPDKLGIQDARSVQDVLKCKDLSER